MDLLTRFERVLAAYNLANSGERIVVGVSGGPDSLVLLHLLMRAREKYRLEPYAVHLNHQIRGKEAQEDAEFVCGIAQEWDIPCHLSQINVPELASKRRLSLEEAARQARYTTLGQQALKLGAKTVAVAHNADDQAETVLMHLMRGAGLLGLRGMLPMTSLSDYHLLEPMPEVIQLMRPLLDVSRADIEAYCIEFSLAPRFDRSNLDTTFFRNRLRHEIFPVLEDINPNVKVSLTRTGSVLSAYYDVLKPHIDEAWADITLELSGSQVRLDLEKWRVLPLALQRAAIRRSVWHLRHPMRDVSFQHVEDAVEVAQHGDTGAQATLPGGLSLRVGYDALVIAFEGAELPAPDWPLLKLGTVLNIPFDSECMLPGSDWSFSLFRYDGPRTGPAWESLIADPWITLLNADVLSETLLLRTREPGDRFFPLGLGGSQKVSTFMINEKIPAAWRDRIPLLVSNDQVVWVSGWRVDERFTVRDATEEIWLARFSASGDNT